MDDLTQRRLVFDPGKDAPVSAAAVAERMAQIPPTLIVTAGNDNPLLNATVQLYAGAVAGKGEVTRLHHPTGQHAFDILADDATSAGIMPRRSTTSPSTCSRAEAEPRAAGAAGSGRMAP